MIYYIDLLFTQLMMSLGSLLIVYNLYFFIVFIIIIIIFSHLYINSSLYVLVLLSLNRPMFVCNPSETKVFSLMNSLPTHNKNLTIIRANHRPAPLSIANYWV